jgi:hypothetical protein
VRTQAGRAGVVEVTARHPGLGAARVRLVAREPDAVPRLGPYRHPPALPAAPEPGHLLEGGRDTRQE